MPLTVLNPNLCSCCHLVCQVTLHSLEEQEIVLDLENLHLSVFGLVSAFFLAAMFVL